MKRLFSSLILSFLMVVAGPADAVAGRVFFKAHGGISSINPDDVNDGLDRFNELAGGPFLGHINSSLDGGLSVGYDLTPELGLGLGYTRLWAGSGFSWQGFHFEYDMPANIYDAFIEYLPANGRKIRIGAGANLGLIQSSAAIRSEDPIAGELVTPLDGSGFLFAGFGLVDAEVAANWSLYGQAGFRHAVINTLKADGEIVFNPDSFDDKLRFNYSGFYLRVGIKFQP